MSLSRLRLRVVSPWKAVGIDTLVVSLRSPTLMVCLGRRPTSGRTSDWSENGPSVAVFVSDISGSLNSPAVEGRTIMLCGGCRTAIGCEGLIRVGAGVQGIRTSSEPAMRLAT